MADHVARGISQKRQVQETTLRGCPGAGLVGNRFKAVFKVLLNLRLRSASTQFVNNLTSAIVGALL